MSYQDRNKEDLFKYMREISREIDLGSLGEKWKAENELDPEVVSHNVIQAESVANAILEEIVGHLQETGSTCVRACIGELPAHYLNLLTEDERMMILILTLRILAEHRLDQQGKIASNGG